MSKRFTCTIFLLSFLSSVQAQLIIDNSLSSSDLVCKVFADANDNFIIENITFTGRKSAIGSFMYKLEFNQLPSKGIILSTGNIIDAIGPNNVPNMNTETYKMENSGDSDLSQLAREVTFDASVLEFEFMSVSDSISFSFFFASEEYPEFINRNVNDIFGFFLIDKANGTKQNIALLPNSKTLISIDNVNSLKNPEYFIENPTWDSKNLDFFSTRYDLAELSRSLQFDGLTIPIQVGAKVESNKWYSLKIAVADVGDDIFDSAVFLEEESFNSVGKASAKMPTELLTEIFSDNIIELNDSLLFLNFNIAFASDSAMFVGENSYSFLNRIYDVLKYDPSINIEIQGYTDNVGSKEYNLGLSIRRANRVMNYLLSLGLEKDRITASGFGNTKPISFTDNELNRRVEFLLYK